MEDEKKQILLALLEFNRQLDQLLREAEDQLKAPPRRSPEMTHLCSSKVSHVGNAISNPFCDRKCRASCNIGVLGMTVGGL